MLPDWLLDILIAVSIPGDLPERLGLMAWPLLVTALVAAVVALERALFFLYASVTWWRHFNRITELMQGHIQLPKALRDELAAMEMERIAASCFAGLRILKLAGVIAPLMGLTGTVLGIIAAFQVIAAHSGPVSPSLIADGMWEAMMTTAAGLFIAIPSVAMEHLYRAVGGKRLERLRFRLNAESMRLELSKLADTHETPVVMEQAA